MRIGAASDSGGERAINTATGYAKTSGDRATLGLVAFRTGGYLTKKGRHRESINHLTQALEAHLITGNYEMVVSLLCEHRERYAPAREQPL
jgi:hypothetical protein